MYVVCECKAYEFKGPNLICVTKSLIATIRKERPDLLRDQAVEGAKPIEESMPPHFLDRNEIKIDDIGVPTNACFFTMTNVNPTDW